MSRVAGVSRSAVQAIKSSIRRIGKSRVCPEMISSTSLAIDKDYEVLNEVKTLNKTYYKIKAETGEEIYSNADNFIKGKEDE